MFTDDPRIVALHFAGDLLDMSDLDESTQQRLQHNGLRKLG